MCDSIGYFSLIQNYIGIFYIVQYIREIGKNYISTTRRIMNKEMTPGFRFDGSVIGFLAQFVLFG